jgi:predicted ATP-binding protein involved in virulence
MFVPDYTPLVKSFLLVGLHGYKNIRVDFQAQTKIIIAENGAGKTIFLSALDSFLTKNFIKLSTIHFERIECELEGHSKPLILSKRQLPAVTDDAQSGLREFANYAEVSPSVSHRSILQYNGDYIGDTPILNSVWMNSPWSVEETEGRIRQLQALLGQTRTEEVDEITSVLNTCLSGTEILYLPTYRRIELSIFKRKDRTPALRLARLRGRVELDDSFEEQSNLGINYGLADVEEKLRSLTDFIQRRSNIGYREISAAIIDDLLAGRFPSASWQKEALPELDAIRLFFSRIEQSPSDAEQRLGALAELYDSGRIDDVSNEPLRYFLARLSKVVDQTKELEADIESFVRVSNNYLSQSADRKLLVYDSAHMKVRVINVWDSTEIRFDDLSSGEKQVISLFAHLYLSRKKQIVLIDEPELSLSIEWQRRLLPDVVQSPTCRQLLAITHSPFVFENELDPYASSLDVTHAKKGKASL